MVLGRWFLSMGPMTQQTREAPCKFPTSGGVVASQQAVTRTTGRCVWKGHGQQELYPTQTLIRREKTP